MKTKDVRLGEVYTTKVGNERVDVTVYARDETGSHTRWRVRRVDNDAQLPKSRTAAALHPIPGKVYFL